MRFFSFDPVVFLDFSEGSRMAVFYSSSLGLFSFRVRSLHTDLPPIGSKCYLKGYFVGLAPFLVVDLWIYTDSSVPEE